MNYLYLLLVVTLYIIILFLSYRLGIFIESRRIENKEKMYDIRDIYLETGLEIAELFLYDKDIFLYAIGTFIHRNKCVRYGNSHGIGYTKEKNEAALKLFKIAFYD